MNGTKTPHDQGDGDDGSGDDSNARRELFERCRTLAKGIKTSVYELVEMKELKPNTTKNLHKMWDSVRVIRHKDTGVLQEAVQCGQCKKVLIFHERKNGNRNVSRHLRSAKCKKQGAAAAKTGADVWQEKIDPEAHVKRAFVTVTAEYCAWDLRPPECVKNQGLVNLIQAAIDVGWRHGRVDARKLLPCPTTVAAYTAAEAKNARDQLADEVRPLMDDYRVAATTDCWTDDHKKEKYLVLTIHYIKDWVLHARLLHTIALPHGESCSAENIGNLLKQCFIDCDLDPSLMSKIKWVSDSGSDIKKALEDFCWIYCASHSLNIVLRTALSIKYADVVEAALSYSVTAQNIVSEANTWVREVRAGLSKLKVPIKDFKFRTSLTASQSNVAMLKSIMKHRDTVNGILGKDAPTALNSYSNALIQQLVNFLHPFDLDGSRGDSPQMTVSRYLTVIEPHLRENIADSEMVADLKIGAHPELLAMDVLIDGYKFLYPYYRFVIVFQKIQFLDHGC